MSRTELSMSDEWETPQDLYNELCATYQFYPTCDVAANKKNKKCDLYFGPDNEYRCQRDGLKSDWDKKNWCNPPHSQTELWVKKACREFGIFQNETMMIIPANATTALYAKPYIGSVAESYPLYGRIKFLYEGKTYENARNGYYVILWRKR